MERMIINGSKGFLKQIFNKRVIFFIIFFWLVTPVYSSEKLISCEVLEVSNQNRAGNQILKNINYILFHHANAVDRDKISSWLKRNDGKEIIFIVDGKRYKGVIYRMAHCFGRGLIIHMNDLSLKKRDLFNLIISYN